MKFKDSLQKQIKYYKIDSHLFFNLIIKKSNIIFLNKYRRALS